MKLQRGALFLADSRGANLVEYMVAVGFIAVVAIGGFRQFGSSVLGKAEDQAACVESFDCAPGSQQGANGRAPGVVMPARPANPKGLMSTPPGFDGIVEGATLQKVPGQPFAEGQGDGNPVHPNDATQGSLNDCYVIAGLQAIAQRDPDVIKNAIRDNGDGTYTVTFYEERSWYDPRGPEKVEITVTNEFPVDSNGNPVFAKPGDGSGDQRELWPMILEKAYAQYKGGYTALNEGGQPDELFRLLTGKDSDLNGDQRYEEWWGGPDGDDLADAWENGDAIVVGTPDDGSPPKIKDGTLVAKHAYVVTNVDRNNKTVTIRNPWGYEGSEITLTFDEFDENFVSIASGELD